MRTINDIIPSVSVPEGSSGSWRVQRFTVSEDDAKLHNMRAAFRPGGANDIIEPGAYTRLMRGATVVMSDTPMEKRDHVPFVHAARGHVLIHGLGLGMALAAILEKPEVERVTVIEKSPDVISLVAPSYDDPRVEIVEGDAFTWRPPRGVRFGAVWHDIWDDKCADNLGEMKRLHRRYGRRADWQGSWGRAFIEHVMMRAA